MRKDPLATQQLSRKKKTGKLNRSGGVGSLSAQLLVFEKHPQVRDWDQYVEGFRAFNYLNVSIKGTKIRGKGGIGRWCAQAAGNLGTRCRMGEGGGRRV